jgi:molybdenum cofactor biosynthesis protein B
MAKLLADAGHVVVERVLLTNDEGPLRAALNSAHEREGVDAVLCTGGTGLGSGDRTIDVVRPLLDREIQGFGELCRALSYLEQVEAAAMLSRALAGAARGKSWR